MHRLIAGYGRFRLETWPQRRERLEQLAEEGQRPIAIVIACSDSRADPALVFDAGPGELFVIRNVANIVPPYQPDGAYHGTSAALEFGVRVLEVPNIIVMGHAQCGGLSALINGVPDQTADFVSPWISLAEPALEAARARSHEGDLQTACEQETVKLSLDNLRTFPWIAEREAEGRLALHGFRFGIRSGQLERMDAEGRFQPVPVA